MNFSVLKSDGASRFLYADVVDGQLLVFDAVSGQIRVYYDADADGVPEAPTASSPFDVSSSSAVIGIDGFYYHQGKRCLKCLYTNIRRGRHVELQYNAAGYELPVFDDRDWVTHLWMHKLVAGVRFIRVVSKPGVTISARAEGHIIGSALVSNSEYVDIALSKQLPEGAVVELDSGGVVPTVMLLVEPKSLIAYPAMPGAVVEGDTFLVNAYGFSGDPVVEVRYQGGVFQACTVNGLPNDQLAIKVPDLAAGESGTSAVFRILDVDQSGATSQSVAFFYQVHRQ